MKADLASEFDDAVSSVCVEHYRRLVSLGCPIKGLARIARSHAPFGVARVRWLADGLYEPAEDGDPALVMAVMPEMGDLLTPEPVDLIAWNTSHPRRWAWRVGGAAALGEYLLDECDILSVVATPFDWLACAGEALCVLDWNAPPTFWSQLRAGPRLVLPDHDLRRRITSAISRSVILPDMEVADAA